MQDCQTDFNSKWFQIYKIVLAVFAFSQILYGISSITDYIDLTASSFFYVVIILQPFVLAAAVILELLAMKNRSLTQAKFALIGFGAYIGLYFVLIGYIVMSNFTAGFKTRLILQSLISLAVFCVAIVYGGFKVYQVLKQSEAQGNNDYKGVQNA